MYILHSVKKSDFDINKKYYGNESINKFGFIHCSDIDTYYLVAPNFKEEKEGRLLLVIDTNSVTAPIKWEENYGVKFPHIYGLLNTSSVVETLPHLWNEKREWIPNEELKKYLSNSNNNLYRKI